MHRYDYDQDRGNRSDNDEQYGSQSSWRSSERAPRSGGRDYRGRDEQDHQFQRDQSFGGLGRRAPTSERDWSGRGDDDRSFDGNGYRESYSNDWDRQQRPQPWSQQQRGDEANRGYSNRRWEGSDYGSGTRGYGAHDAADSSRSQRPRWARQGSFQSYDDHSPSQSYSNRPSGEGPYEGSGPRGWESQYDRGLEYGPRGSGFGRQQQSYGDHVNENRGKGPKGYERSDDRIREDVCDRLTDSTIDASDIEVEVKDGNVTLKGNVSDRWTKRQLEDIACEGRGVKDCRSQIRIQSASDSHHQSSANRKPQLGDDKPRDKQTA